MADQDFLNKPHVSSRASRAAVSCPRLIAIDVDHTLLRDDGTLADATVKAIHRASAQHVEIVLASSRPPSGMQDIIFALSLRSPAVFVALQGALIASYDLSGRCQMHHSAPIPLGDALRVVEVALGTGITVNWYSGQAWYASSIDAAVSREAEVVGFAPQVRDLRAETTGPEKLLLIDGPGRVASDLPLPTGVAATGSNPGYLEITRRGVDKASAVSRVAAWRGIALSEVAAIGDGHNDLGMLALAGTGIAPANAAGDVLRAADYLTDSNEDDGVAAAIDALLDDDLPR